MNTKEKKLAPPLRFKGFTDAWEQRKLGEVLIPLRNNTLTRAELSDKGIAKNIHYGDILVKYGEVLDVENEALPMISNREIVDKFDSSRLKNGDIIVADTAEDETVGKCTEVVGITGETVLAGLHTIPYRATLKFSCGYLGYYMNSDAYHHQLLPLMQGIKVTSVGRTAMENTVLLFPKSVCEQFQISAFFQHIDKLIALHQRKSIFL